MKQLSSAFVVLILLQILATNEAFKLKNLRKKSERVLNRAKRAWAYQPVSVAEWIPTFIGEEFEPYSLFTIKSDAPEVTSYGLTGDGVDDGTFSLVEDKDNDIWNIRLMKPLDYEVEQEYEMHAYAYDSAGGQLEAPTLILVLVIDQNDNKPKFVPETLYGAVMENAVAGTRVSDITLTADMQIVAEDADSQDKGNGFVRYYYDNHEVPSGTRFAVSKSGYVTVVGKLDYETAKEITFSVIARDGSEVQENGYKVNTTVHITVLDSNDHKPQFLGLPYSTSKGELLDVGSTVFTVRANDEDIGDNRATYFKITGGDFKDQFEMKSNPNAQGESTGQIILAKPLDFETGPQKYNLEIRAYNKDASNADDSNFFATANVEIEVTDENEPPIFQNTPYSGKVTENILDANKVVTTVTATDPDFGGQSVSYSIVSTEGWFSIDPTSGVVKNIEAVDREDQAVNQENSIYDLMVRATDDYNPQAYNQIPVAIRIIDLNDNRPGPLGGSWNAQICETPQTTNVTVITAVDPDSDNGPPFTMNIADTEEYNNQGYWILEPLNGVSAIVMTFQTQFNLDKQQKYLVPISIVDTPSPGEAAMTGTGTLTINICHCNNEGVMDCTTTGTVAGAGFPVAIVVGIIAAILILLIIVLAVVAYRRNQDASLLKQPILLDDDDVRENLQAYHDEGGGEEDNDGYDISALQNPPLLDPKRQDEPPLTNAQPQPRSRIPPNADIGDYINDAKNQADNDPTAPPFDSLLVFDYEGAGSDAGSLSSLNSGTTDGSQDYDHLNNWGPRFKKLADMYGGGESD